jgi:hypothetical protein
MGKSHTSCLSNQDLSIIGQTDKQPITLSTFKSVYSSGRVSFLIQKHYPDYRERGFPPSVTLGGWITQNLAADRSCSAAVDRVNADRISNDLEPFSPNTGAYCGARERMPEAFLQELLLQEAKELEQHVPKQWTWGGKKVTLVDGMTVTLSDTDEIKKEFPLSESQKTSNSLPLARIVGMFSLATGGLLEIAIGPYCGKETGEHALLRTLIPSLKSGEVLMGDGIYPSYFCLAILIRKGIDGVFAAGTRRVDFRGGEKLGKKDHLIVWEKPRRPEWMSQEEYDQFPPSIKIRELATSIEKPGFRTEKKILFTTILDKKVAPREELSILFSRRWEIEVHFRSIKSDLQMDFIPTKTPEMVRKDIYITLLGYNLIRKIMCEAAQKYNCLPTQLSFKRTVQVLESYRKLWELGKIDREYVYNQILLTAGKIRVGKRPNRCEPRKTRRTKDRFPTLKKPRNSKMNLTLH